LGDQSKCEMLAASKRRLADTSCRSLQASCMLHELGTVALLGSTRQAWRWAPRCESLRL